MQIRLNFLAAAILSVSVLTGLTQTISWTGSGDAVSWAEGANWSGGVVPGPGNDVTITSGAGPNVVISSGNINVRSIRCSKALALSGGSLTLTAGASQVTGAFGVSRAASLTVSGAGTSLTVSGPTTDADGNLYALGGGVLRLASLVQQRIALWNTYRSDSWSNGPDGRIGQCGETRV